MHERSECQTGRRASETSNQVTLVQTQHSLGLRQPFPLGAPPINYLILPLSAKGQHKVMGIMFSKRGGRFARTVFTIRPLAFNQR